ncbi:MAG: hypothetical protein J6A75_08780 [Lachnospiraceae bacterium]|nr:hypothetical protein [Lachnospiraceae bacterium]
MKNAAGMIGILPLAGMAKILEDAANHKDIGRLTACHEVFLSEWREYKQKLQPCINGEAEERIAVGTEVIAELLLMLREAAEDMDIDRMDNIALQLNQYQYTQEDAVKLEKISEAVARFDLDKIMELTDAF